MLIDASPYFTYNDVKSARLNDEYYTAERPFGTVDQSLLRVILGHLLTTQMLAD